MPLNTYIHSIRPSGLLSFAPDTPPLQLRPLNVLIGPNASGKSNLVDVLGLVRSMPTDLQEPMRRGGGVEGWLWKGSGPMGDASLELVVELFGETIFHRIAFRGVPIVFGGVHYIAEIGVQSEEIISPKTTHYRSDSPANTITMTPSGGQPITTAFHEQHRRDQSALSQFRSHAEYFVITLLAMTYERFGIYNSWAIGRETVFRRPQATDLRSDRLEEDYSNLGLVLSHMGKSPAAKQSIIEGLHELYDSFTSYEVIPESGYVRILFTEGQRSIPATRLSDGTIRYLCLLAILYNPNPPPVVCIEEPELGLHPDVVAGLAKHLRAASERMQLIVTTHSDILIDALSDTPESVVVFENHNGATQMKRLDADNLSVWLEKYSLGQLWTKGHIGGSRW